MIERYTRDVEVRNPHPTLVRWGAVIAGGILGLGILIAMSAFWLALAYGSDISWVQDDLGWYLGGSAVMSLFLASYLAGWMQGPRGWNPGLMAGVTLWALTLLIMTLGAVPTAIAWIPGPVAASPEQAEAVANTASVNGALWVTFLSIIGTLLASAFGGALGGATPRREAIYAPEGRSGMQQREVQVRMEPDDHDHDETVSRPTTTTSRSL